MDRRTLLAGAGTVVIGAVAGCTSNTSDTETQDGDESGENDELTRPESACEGGMEAVKAAADGDGERIEWLAPMEYFDEKGATYKPDPDDWNELVFNDIRELDCEVTHRDDDIDDDDSIDAGAQLMYTFEFSYDDETHEGRAKVHGFERDEGWYVWIFSGLSSDETSVDADTTEEQTVEFTLTELDIADGVYIDGHGIDRTDEHVLTEVGDSVTISWDTHGRVEYSAYAYIGDPASPDAQRLRYDYGHGSDN